jgi:hypothetical protein
MRTLRTLIVLLALVLTGSLTSTRIGKAHVSVTPGDPIPLCGLRICPPPNGL